jgi:hypothetical protein
MSALKESGMINDQDFEAIAYKNAERLLDVRIPDGNEVGLEVDGEGADGEADRRKMAWLVTTDSASSVNSDGVPFPHSPLDTVHEER